MLSEKFTSICLEACKKFAKSNGISVHDAQIVLTLKDGWMECWMYRHYSKSEKWELKKILNLTLDILGIENKVRTKITGLLKAYCIEHDAKESDMHIMIVPDGGSDVYVWLYKGGDAIAQLDTEEIFKQ